MPRAHVRVVVDPLSLNPPLPHDDHPDRFFLKFIYKAHATKVDSQGVHHEVIDYKTLDIPMEEHIFLLPQHEVREYVSIMVAVMGVPRMIHDSVVQKITEKGMRMAAAGLAEEKRVYEAVARIQVQVRNWNDDDALLAAWRLRELDEEEVERLVAESQSLEEYEYHGCPASASAIDALERRKFGGEEEEDEVKCIICLDDIMVGSSLLRMPCMHDFHECCLVQWLKQHHVCPLCRHQLPKET